MSDFPADPAERVRARLGGNTTLEPLPGDASDRRYFRARRPDEPDRVVMALAAAFDPPWLPFERMTTFLHEGGFPVPRILARHPADGLLVLEDLGDTSLQSHLEGVAADDAGAWRRLYEEAVDLIVRLQRKGTPALVPDLPAYHFALDELRFGRELDYFVTHYIGGLLGDPLAGEPEAEQLTEALGALARRAGAPGDRVLCHRDFHSRNLMLPDGREPAAGQLVMLDYQDARLGPRTYDLASLLCDAYLDVPAGLAAQMRERFLQGVGREDTAAFEAEYAVVATQRTLKAVGTFAGQKMRFGTDRYLRCIPRALAAAREALGAIPDLAALRDLLDGPLAYRPPNT